jgi:hypothetical protein
MFRLFTAGCALVLCTCIAAADQHHDGQAKVKGVKNGSVHLGATKHGHAAHAVMKNGKMTGLTVHKNGKDVTNTVTTKKFKTKNKKHLTDGVVVDQGIDDSLVTLWIGFGFFCPFDNIWHIFWFPVELVADGEDGAEELCG